MFFLTKSDEGFILNVVHDISLLTMGEIIDFSSRGKKGRQDSPSQGDVDSDNKQRPKGGAGGSAQESPQGADELGLFDYQIFGDKEMRDASPGGKAVIERLEREREEMIRATPPEEILNYESAQLARRGLNISHCTELIHALKSLVPQIPPAVMKNRENEYRALIRGYTFENVIAQLNNAHVADLQKTPIFYHVLVEQLTRFRNRICDQYIGHKLAAKRREDANKDPSEPDK